MQNIEFRREMSGVQLPSTAIRGIENLFMVLAESRDFANVNETLHLSVRDLRQIEATSGHASTLAAKMFIERRNIRGCTSSPFFVGWLPVEKHQVARRERNRSGTKRRSIVDSGLQRLDLVFDVRAGFIKTFFVG